MKEDIVIEVAKRTCREVVSQVSNISWFVFPFAVAGLFLCVWWVSVLAIIIMVGTIAHNEYKEVLSEIENGSEPEESTVKVEKVEQPTIDETTQK